MDSKDSFSYYEKRFKQHRHYASVQIWHTATLLCYGLALVYIWFFYLVYDPSQDAPVNQVARVGNKVAVGEVVTLPFPRHTDTALRTWTNEAMNNVLNFSFLKFNEEVQSYQQYFTEDGYISFTNYLKTHDLHGILGRDKQIQRGTVIGQILSVGGSKGFVDDKTGRRYWQVIVPMNIARTSGKTVNRKAEFTLVIVMETDNKGRSGFFIDELREK